MRYDKIEIIRAKIGKHDHKSLKYRVTKYHSGVEDKTGLGGTWSVSGHLFDVYQVGNYLVAHSFFHGGYPVAVWRHEDEMREFLGKLSDTIVFEDKQKQS